MPEINLKITGGAVRFGAVYGRNRVFSGTRGGGGGDGGGAAALPMSRSVGGLGSGLGVRGGLGLGSRLGLGLRGGAGARMGLGAGVEVGAGAGLWLRAGVLALGGGAGQGLGFGGAALSRLTSFRAGVAPLRVRLGDHVFKIGVYGFNPSFLNPITTVDTGSSSMPTIDPLLPSVKEVQLTRLREKEELQVLNNKFASFIDKARALEQQNAILKAKISMFTNPDQGGPASTSILLTSAIGTYKTQIDTLAATKEAIIAEIDHYKGIIDEVQARLEEESSHTKTLETEWTNLKEEVDNIYLTIFELLTNIGGLEDQITLSKQVYDSKVKEVRTIVTGGLKSAFSISVDNEAQAHDLTTALGDVKAHYEMLAQHSKHDAFHSVQDSLSMMSVSSQPSIQSLTTLKEELRVYKLQIDSVQREIDRLKEANIALEGQVDEAESHGSSHTETYQDQITVLKLQLDDIRKQIAQYGQEYQELLASKMSLDVEITAYKKLLDSEENRLKSGGGVTVHMSKTVIGGGGAGGGGAGAGAGLGLGAGGGLGLGYGAGLGAGFGGGLGAGLGGGLGGGAGAGAGLGLRGYGLSGGASFEGSSNRLMSLSLNSSIPTPDL